MTRTRFDPLAIFRRLAAHRVRYVLIGGMAAKAHGSPTLTVDVDVCPARDRDNLERLGNALGDLGSRLRDVPGDLPSHPDRRTLERAELLTLATDHGALDVVMAPPGIGGFAELDANAESVDVGEGLVVRVASLDDLIAMKRAAGRPKDRVELEILGALRDEIEGS